ncbi:hypothetical protein, partial [Paracoccus sp. SSK6]|uniref:hypothetical protein n=1 Tax=Paracoccus sp. SSK6 TaxID=3143131 RepID=UPI003219C2D7
MNRRYLAAKGAAAELASETTKIRSATKHSRLTPLAVHLALDVPITIDGVITRFCALHGSYLRFIERARTWQFYQVDRTTQVGEWTTIQTHKVERLLAQLIDGMKAENTIIVAAVLKGIISEKPKDYTKTLTLFVDALGSNLAQRKAILRTLEEELAFNGKYVAPEKPSLRVA